MSTNMKPETIAARLSETKAAIQKLEAGMAEVEAEYADELAVLNDQVSQIRSKISQRTRQKQAKVAELKAAESEYRNLLMNADYIGAKYFTDHGQVSVEANPTPHVTRFSSIPDEFRKDPDQCILGPEIKKAFKAGSKVPGVKLIDMPKVVVR